MANGQQVDGAVIVQREWRTLVRFALEGLAAGLVASLVFGLAVFIVTSPAIAATPDATGALYLKDESGHRTATPLVFTDVRMSVTGIVNRVTVEQRFLNPTDEWREGVYVFPFPDKAAVDHLRMGKAYTGRSAQGRWACHCPRFATFVPRPAPFRAGRRPIAHA